MPIDLLMRQKLMKGTQQAAAAASDMYGNWSDRLRRRVGGRRRRILADRLFLSGWTSVIRGGSTHRPAMHFATYEGLACAERA